jgi:NAD(P)-dependent dehydrogenase (short-subunit alcohol dehydrogenase family)
MAGRVQDKIALITGGGSGIGRATSLLFAKEGAKVVVADYNAEGGERTVRMIKDHGGWLLSDAASFVTGHPMVIDGGWVAR